MEVSHMHTLSQERLKDLLDQLSHWCVSIYLPTDRTGIETQQDRLRLKNLLKTAAEQLATHGLSVPQVERLLEPAIRLLSDGLFWRHQADGLALFCASDQMHVYRLPISFKELAVVTDRFHVKPLLPIFSGDGRFYILALSQNEIRLLQGTRDSVSEVELETVPASLAEALKDDDPEKQLQFHTGTVTPAGQGRRPAIFHGQGVGIDDAKVNLARYFRQVDDGLREILGDESAPLILAGVDYLLPIYRIANTYGYVVAESIVGNPESMSAKELHQRAWTIVQPHFLEAQRTASDRYRHLSGAGSPLVSSDLSEIVRAAYWGRVETLFVAVGIQQWGKFDPDTNRVEPRATREPGDADLLDFAAVQALYRGGTVYAVEPEKVPAESPVAAIFRYE
jgi:Bacterial archaeo-eukaryotic release factor family 7